MAQDAAYYYVRSDQFAKPLPADDPLAEWQQEWRQIWKGDKPSPSEEWTRFDRRVPPGQGQGQVRLPGEKSDYTGLRADHANQVVWWRFSTYREACIARGLTRIGGQWELHGNLLRAALNTMRDTRIDDWVRTGAIVQLEAGSSSIRGTHCLGRHLPTELACAASAPSHRGDAARCPPIPFTPPIACPSRVWLRVLLHFLWCALLRVLLRVLPGALSRSSST